MKIAYTPPERPQSVQSAFYSPRVYFLTQSVRPARPTAAGAAVLQRMNGNGSTEGNSITASPIGSMVSRKFALFKNGHFR